MDIFLLKIIDENGEEVWDENIEEVRNIIGYIHIDSFAKFATKNNLSIPLFTDEEAALSLASINYISILNLRNTGYLLYLPKACSEQQINYFKNVLPFYKEEEKNKYIEVAIYSKEPLYYNHKNFRDLVIEEEIDILEGRKKNKTLVTELLEEELARQKKIIESKKEANKF